MPRKPARHLQSFRTLPFPFSPFGRSIAQMASAKHVKQCMQSLRFERKSDTCFADGGSTKHDLEKDNEQSESSDEDISEGVVRADFDFCDLVADDFHKVKLLLQTYLDDKQWDMTGFVDLILKQSNVGKVVLIEDDEDDHIFSFISALNLGRYKEDKCVMGLKEYLLKACGSQGPLDELKVLLEEKAKSVGLLVCQRVVNFPPQLLPQLYNLFFEQISDATKAEPTAELRDAFRFKFYLMVSRIYKHKNAEHRKRQNRTSDEEIIYFNPEDEIFHKLCTWSFSFPLKEQPATHELRQYRLMGLVMAVKADKIPEFQQQLQCLINES